MRTEQEIKTRIESLNIMLDDEDNQNELMQIKLWNTIDTLNWVLRGGKNVNV